MSTGDFLRQTTLFSGCGDDEIATVLSTAKEREFAEGDVIVRQGHPGGAGFYLVLSGSVEVRRDGAVVASRGPGEFFGEMALLLDDTPRSADVVATSPTRCLVITKWDLRAMLAAHPELGVRMMSELARRLSEADRTLSP